MKKTNHTKEITLAKETEQNLLEPYKDATVVNMREDGETYVRMWVKNGKRTACAFHHGDKLWTILFDGENRVYQNSSYAFDVEFDDNERGQALKKELDTIADEAWDEYRHLV